MIVKTPSKPDVVIIDYGMGNLYSVYRACQVVGLRAVISSDWTVAEQAGAIILPGVGAFGDAMTALKKSGMDSFLKAFAFSSKPLLGICLGVQLLMTESYEFGIHKGLNIVEGTVTRFENSSSLNHQIKVPHVGWNRVNTVPHRPGQQQWNGTLLDGIGEGEYFYFVHSYYVKIADTDLVLSTTRYGGIDFCSTLQKGKIFACQYHPEKSGPPGLRIYKNLAKWLEVKPVLKNGNKPKIPDPGSKNGNTNL